MLCSAQLSEKTQALQRLEIQSLVSQDTFELCVQLLFFTQMSSSLEPAHGRILLFLCVLLRVESLSHYQ